jgi:hypothetical protein
MRCPKCDARMNKGYNELDDFITDSYYCVDCETYLAPSDVKLFKLIKSLIHIEVKKILKENK